MAKIISLAKRLADMNDDQLNQEFSIMKDLGWHKIHDIPMNYSDATSSGQYVDMIYKEMTLRGMYNPNRGKRTIVRRCS